jgi:hypothetical protein
MEQYVREPPSNHKYREHGEEMDRMRLMRRHRHDDQPPQVLPLDATNCVALVRVRHLGAGDAGHGGIHDGCAYMV